jgi:hypothetical protein
VAGFDRNGWPTSVGIGGRIASESVAALRRITQSASAGAVMAKMCCRSHPRWQPRGSLVTSPGEWSEHDDP